MPKFIWWFKLTATFSKPCVMYCCYFLFSKIHYYGFKETSLVSLDLVIMELEEFIRCKHKSSDFFLKRSGNYEYDNYGRGRTAEVFTHWIMPSHL
jgi:hypothetical protein